MCIGTIADREHRKWIEKAVPLQNNPYSKESLEKRLSRTSVDSGTSTLQSRWVHFLMSFVCSLLLGDCFHFAGEYNSVLMKYLRRKKLLMFATFKSTELSMNLFLRKGLFWKKEMQKKQRFDNSEKKFPFGHISVTYPTNSQILNWVILYQEHYFSIYVPYRAICNFGTL